MVEIEFLGPINKEILKVDASNLKEVKDILNKDDSLKEWLEICAVAINDSIITNTNTPLKDGDKISLLPPVCGG